MTCHDRGANQRRLTRRALLAGGVGGSSLLAPRDARSRAAQLEGSPVASPAGGEALRWQGRGLRVGGWGGEVQAALRDAIFDPFAAETGCDVREVFTDYDRLESDPAYADALVVDPTWAAAALAEGLVEPIPDDAVNRSLLGPVAATDGSIPAYAYAMVSAFRRDAVMRVEAPVDWTAWWNTDRYAARRSLPRQALGTFEFALLADGVPPAELYPLDAERAISSLERIKDQVEDRWWDDGLQPIAWLSRNRADFAAAWHYRVIAGQQDGRDVDFVWNQGLLIADHWVVPRGARNQDVALDLIRFATSPPSQSALARAIPLGPITPDAFDLLGPAESRLLPTAPEHIDQLVALDPAWWAANGTAVGERFDEWRTGAEADA
ncbi:MAG: extracellular solute-binding protein [Thermomicrobiales bacterium]